MKVLNMQEISSVSGGATAKEILDMGIVYGAAVGTVVGSVAGAVILSSGRDPSPMLGLVLGAVGGMVSVAVLGLTFSTPFAALYGEK